MAARPDISPGDEILVGNRFCVVSTVREPGHAFGDCEVVFNQSKPTNHDAVWIDDHWEFPERGDFGGYADKYECLRPFVNQLRRRR